MNKLLNRIETGTTTTHDAEEVRRIIKNRVVSTFIIGVGIGILFVVVMFAVGG